MSEPAGAAESALPSEFGLIGRHFRPLAGPGALDLEDDAAVLVPPPGRELVMAADAMVAGVHYLPDDPADGVARKLLRVNLSDLAAMGATPLGYLLTVSAPTDTPDAWFAAFARGLAADQAIFDVTLLGGDTTSTPGPVTLSLTIIGHVAPGAAVRRRGAKAGDEVWVTGTIGDGALGLAASLGKLDDPSGYLRARYCVPSPRLGLPLTGRASAAIDVSDGLLQDLGHLCRLAGCGAEIEAGLVPLSDAARAAGPAWLADCLGGGDDYELLLAVPEGRGEALAAACATLGVPLTRIGRFTEGPMAVRVIDAAHETVTVARHGWSHF
ncbi:thiamine-phosphate kinase [Acidisoma sp.]|uniref:thiamine-phosphate kinase n=1 Tax=Acidisoma sp. TaxID=1872115 RepID=UPI003AFF8A0A